jgi:hypothetical protein
METCSEMEMYPTAILGDRRIAHARRRRRLLPMGALLLLATGCSPLDGLAERT